MLIPEFTAPSYRDRNINAIQRCVNFFPEKTAHGYVLISDPGIASFGAAANNAACRGAYYSSTGKLFSANGTVLYEVSAAGTFTSRGSLASSTAFVTFADDGTNLLICENGQGAYTLVMASGSTVAVTDVNFPTPTQVTWQNGYFIVGQSGTGRFYLSALNDPTTWTPAAFATAESKADALLGLHSDGKLLYLLGSKTLEVWYNTGNSSFTFERLTGGVYNIGTADGNSIGKFNDRFFFFSSTDGGRGRIFEVVNGGDPRPVSTPYIENAFAQWVVTNNSISSGVIGFCYQTNGHAFYEISSLGGGASYIYDIFEEAWHERETNISGTYTYHRVRTILNAFNTSAMPPFAFDILNGNCYRLGAGSGFPYNSDDGIGIRRLRDFGPIGDNITYLFHKRLRFALEIKHDSSTSYTLSALVQWSDDNGLTYNTGVTVTKAITSGTTGQSVNLDVWRLGRSRQRYYRITFTGPAAYIILNGVDLIAEKGIF